MYTPEKPYIGVTGVSKVNEAHLVRRSFEDAGLVEQKSTHSGMLGVLASQRTLLANLSKPAKYPDLEKMRKIFQTTQSTTFNTVHYSTFNEKQLSAQVKTLMDSNDIYKDKLCHGLQLNMPWPSPSEVEKTKQAHPDLKIILQLGPRVLRETRTERIAERLIEYEGLLNYVLIDPSGGKGEEFGLTRVIPLFWEIKNLYENLTVIFAGGFNPANVKTKLALLAQEVGTKNFGIDAETGLRVQKNSHTEFSTSKAAKYVNNATSFLKEAS